jgi:exosortase H (IPTLxxWG-CTERM-specific)
VLRFVLSFVISLTVLGFVYSFVTARYENSLVPVMRLTATICGWIASLFAPEAFWWDRVVSTRGFTLEIIDECTGVLEIVIFTAAVISWATSVRKKLIGILIGVPIIYAFNIIRIVVLLFVGAQSQAAFDFFHLYFWQVTLILMISSVWIAWLLWVVNREKESVAVSP